MLHQWVFISNTRLLTKHAVRSTLPLLCHRVVAPDEKTAAMACTGNSWTYSELATGVPWRITIAAKPTLRHQSNKCSRISQLVSSCHRRAIFWGSMQDSLAAAVVTRCHRSRRGPSRLAPSWAQPLRAPAPIRQLERPSLVVRSADACGSLKPSSLRSPHSRRSALG